MKCAGCGVDEGELAVVKGLLVAFCVIVADYVARFIGSAIYEIMRW